MRRIIFVVVTILILFATMGCGINISHSNELSSSSNQDTSTNVLPTDNPTTTEPKEDDSYMNKTIELKIGNTIVDVNWLDNDSVKALKELVKDGLTINMSMYGGFEQVGSLGKTITSNDESLTTTVGDICLYQSNQIVIFYGSNTWSYTKLGHISLTKSELTELLGEENLVITLNLK